MAHCSLVATCHTISATLSSAPFALLGLDVMCSHRALCGTLSRVLDQTWHSLQAVVLALQVGNGGGDRQGITDAERKCLTIAEMVVGARRCGSCPMHNAVGVVSGCFVPSASAGVR
jgi:hypothetical protein